MITAAAASCELAGLAGRIRGWLADNGYASAANFRELDHLMLLVAVSGEAAQTGRSCSPGGGLAPGWEKMAARLATPAGKQLYKRRAALVEPGLRPVLRPVRPLPQLPRPRRRRHRDQAPGHRPQPRQAPGPPAPATGLRNLTSPNPETSSTPGRPGPPRYGAPARPQTPARTRLDWPKNRPAGHRQ